MTNNNFIGIDYNNQRLRVLVEEYITQQRRTFTLQGVCNYVLYWAMEEGYTTPAGTTLYESDRLHPDDTVRISSVLDKIIHEGRIVADVEGERFEKVDELVE